jgi:hypothetical protein
LQAVTIVWVAERFTDEHRATLDWLNKRTDEQINFFGLEIELWRIGDSPVAPKFNIVSQPNDWSRTVQAAARETGITEHKQKQLQFWIAFREYMEKNSKIGCQGAYPQHWMNHSIGRTGFHLSSIVTGTSNPEIRVELTISGDKAKRHFMALEQKRQEIEQACGMSLTWHNPTNKNMCRIYTRKDADFLQEGQWPQQQRWLRENLELFQRVFAPIVLALDDEEPLPQGAASVG